MVETVRQTSGHSTVARSRWLMSLLRNGPAVLSSTHLHCRAPMVALDDGKGRVEAAHHRVDELTG